MSARSIAAVAAIGLTALSLVLTGTAAATGSHGRSGVGNDSATPAGQGRIDGTDGAPRPSPDPNPTPGPEPSPDPNTSPDPDGSEAIAPGRGQVQEPQRKQTIAALVHRPCWRLDGKYYPSGREQHTRPDGHLCSQQPSYFGGLPTRAALIWHDITADHHPLCLPPPSNIARWLNESPGGHDYWAHQHDPGKDSSESVVETTRNTVSGSVSL